MTWVYLGVAVSTVLFLASGNCPTNSCIVPRLVWEVFGPSLVFSWKFWLRQEMLPSFPSFSYVHHSASSVTFAMSNSVVLKFSGDVSFMCHPFLVPVIWMCLLLLASYAHFWRQKVSRDGQEWLTGSGCSKIVNNSHLEMVLSGKGAEFLILRRWKSEASSFLIVLFNKVRNLVFKYTTKWSFTLPPLALSAAVQTMKCTWASSTNTVYLLNVTIANDSLGI